MEKKLTEAFEAIQMPKNCTDRIQRALEQKTTPGFRKIPVLRAAAALCVVILLLPTLHPGVAQAVADTAEKTLEWFRSTISRGHGVTVMEDDYIYYNDGHMELEVHKGSSVNPTHDSTLTPYPSWLKEQDGRVWFLANMENQDITELFSQEEPFVYIYDKDGITHYIAIGGNYDPAEGLGSIGYSEWLRRTDPEGNGDWLGGGGAGQYDPETNDYALWYAKAIVEMNIPWNYQSALAIVNNAG